MTMTHDGGHRRIRYIKNLQPPLEASSISLVSQDRSNRFRFHSNIVVCLIVAILTTEANVGIVAAFGTVVTSIGKGSSNTNRGLFYPRITSPSTESYRGNIYDPHCCVTSQINSHVFMAKDIMSNTDSSESICPTEHFRLGYASDVEGHWDYFLEYVQRSNVLDWEDVEKESDFNSSIADSNDASHDTTFQKLALRPNTHFIYGGDSVDKGPGDIRLCRALVSLKQRYPDRVHLLVGNRDLNKLRIWSELSDQDMERPVEEIEKPFWDRGAKSLKEYLEEIRDKYAKNGEDESTSNLDKWNTKAERLRYMLKHTLGCPDTFEFRREEIKILRTMYGCYPSNSHRNANNTPDYIDSIEVTDEEVVESFQYEINHTDGSLRQYLKHASIAAIVGNTIFVHGAIDALTMKFVPSLESKFHLPKSSPPSFTAISSVTTSVEDGTIIDNVHDWVQALNEFLQHGLKDFELRPDWNEERSSRGGEALLAIQNRPSMWGRSVVCNSYGDGGVIATVDSEEERKQALRMAEEQNYPLAFEGIASSVFDPEPAKWLLDHGIQRIVVGHKPTGDCPAVLSSRYTGVEVVSADTSYAIRRDINADHHINKFGECRGGAIAMVEISGPDPFNNYLSTSGTLACGTEYSNRFPLLGTHVNNNECAGDIYLGQKLQDGWWVKSAVPGDTGPSYHLCRGSGRFVEYDVRPIEMVRRELL